MTPPLHTPTQIPTTGWVHLAGAVSAFLYGWLALISQQYANLDEFLTIATACFLICIALWWLHRYSNTQPSLWSVLLWALVFRAIAIFVGEPLLEDDHYRYLWDGYQLVENGTPYGIAPEAFFASSALNERFEDILDNINNPHIATIYGPLCQYLFGLAYMIAPGEVWPLQLAFACLDIGLIVLLLKLAPARQVLLYAWSPLIIKEFAFTAHTDVLAVALMFYAWYLASRSHNHSRFSIPILLACAVASKIFALLLVPFLLGLRIRQWLIFALSLVLIYLPFMLQEGFWSLQGLNAMAGGWLFNAPIYFLFLAWAEGANIQLLKAVLIGLFALVYFYWLWRDIYHQHSQHSLIKALPLYLKNTANTPLRVSWLYGLFLLAIPALNAWYLVWLLPFAVLRTEVWPWVASFSLLLSYATGLHLNDSALEAYQQPNWILLLEYGAIMAALAVDIWRYRRPAKDF